MAARWTRRRISPTTRTTSTTTCARSSNRGRRGGGAILGLGVGLDLSPYYSRCQALDLLGGSVSNQVFTEIVGLLAGRGRR